MAPASEPDQEAMHPILLMIRMLAAGGSERQLTEMVRRFDRSRFQPHVGVMRPEGIRVAEVEAAAIPIEVFPVRSFVKPHVLQSGWKLMQYLRRNRIQIVHAFDVPAAMFAVPFARLAGTPVVLSSQRAHRELLRPVDRKVLRVIDRLVHGTVVNCEYMRRHMVEDNGMAAEKLSLCYNGIDTETFRRDSAAERPPALEGATAVIGVICVLRPEKGLSTLLEAYARIPRRPAGLRLAIVGSGECLGDLQAQAAALGIAGETVFAGEQTRIVPWLRSFDIFVMPSLSEAFSNSIMEAMACGACVVASDVGGTPELVHHEETGMLFPRQDAGRLSETLARLLADRPLRHRLATRGHDRIHGEFGFRKAAGRMEEIYTRLLAPRRKAAV